MKHLPQNVKEKFYAAIKGDVSIDEFEKWLYADKDLERSLGPDAYLDLISFNYKGRGAPYELRTLLRKYIEPGEYETHRILDLLNEARRKTGRQPAALMELYDLYCKGYDFLRKLGLGFGLSVIVPRISSTTANTWEELSKDQRQELLDSFSPDLEEEIDRAIGWINSGQIVLSGEQDARGRYKYQDLRTENRSDHDRV